MRDFIPESNEDTGHRLEGCAVKTVQCTSAAGSSIVLPKNEFAPTVRARTENFYGVAQPVEDFSPLVARSDIDEFCSVVISCEARGEPFNEPCRRLPTMQRERLSAEHRRELTSAGLDALPDKWIIGFDLPLDLGKQVVWCGSLCGREAR